MISYVLSLLLLLTYNSKCNNSRSTPVGLVPGGVSDVGPESFYYERFANGESMSVADIDNRSRDPSMASSGIGAAVVAVSVKAVVVVVVVQIEICADCSATCAVCPVDRSVAFARPPVL